MKLSEAFHYRVLSKQCGVYPVARLLHKRGVPLSEALEILASGTAKLSMTDLPSSKG